MTNLPLQLYEFKAFLITYYKKGGYPSLVMSPRTLVASYIVPLPKFQLTTLNLSSIVKHFSWFIRLVDVSLEDFSSIKSTVTRV